MQISIFQKILPFSNRPGIKMLIPGTTVRATIYPTKIEFHELSCALPQLLGAIQLDLVQPSHPTVLLDLEKGLIIVWGESDRGYYRYVLSGTHADHLLFKLNKGNLTISGDGVEQKDSDSWIIRLKHTSQVKPPLLEKISFGSHRKQDWDLIMRRKDPAEIFPLLYQLAQWIPSQKPAIFEGTASLLPACCKAITENDRNELLKPFENLLNVGYEGLLSPTLVDELHQGFPLKPISPNSQANPLALCVDTALLLRSLLLQSDDHSFKILPALPVSLHCGRALNLRLKDKAVIDMEWSKKQIRRMNMHALTDGDLYLQFPMYVDSFRIRRSDSDIGTLYQNQDPIHVSKDDVLFLDRFQK